MKSKGLGDTIEKFTTATGIKHVVESVLKATGKPCKCGERQQALNDPNLAINKILYK